MPERSLRPLLVLGLAGATALGAGSCSPSEDRPAATVPAQAPRPAEPPSPPYDLEEVKQLLVTEPPGPRRTQLEIAEKIFSGSNRWLGRAQLVHAEAQLAKGAAISMQERVDASTERLKSLLRLGRFEEAAKAADDLAAWLFEVPGLPPEAKAKVLRLQGITQLRLAEQQNCIDRHVPSCCIFPLAGGGIHSVKGPAERMKQAYLGYLEIIPDDPGAIWLLNVAFMALGEYPQGVPPQYLIPPERFASQHDPGRFLDVAPALGLDVLALAGGAIGEDFDGDTLLDIVTSTSDPGGPMTYHRNVGDGTFEDRSAASRLDQQLGGLNCLAADHDGDGDSDILVMRGGWLDVDGRMPKSLLENDGHGTFTDVTAARGLTGATFPSQAAAWGDYDDDGDLDLYIANESGAEYFPAQLFRNDGGSFTDVAREAGVTNDRLGKGTAWGDYDNDGDLDLYVSNIGENRLYRNEGDGTFRDVALELGVTEPKGRSFACWFFDVNEDGWLDLWVAAFQAVVTDVASDVMGLPSAGRFPRLYLNDRGRFRDAAPEMGLERVWLPMGSNFGDVDNDGWQDIYLATGDPEYETIVPNVLLWNDHGKRFLNATTAAGMGHLQKGHGVVLADFDQDGDQDVFNQLGGFYPGDRFHAALYMNPGHGNHWLELKLVGTTSPSQGYGARVVVTVDTPSGKRTLHRAPGCVSSFGGNPSRLEIGLGDASRIRRVEITWPRTKGTQVVEGVPLDSLVEVTEGTEGFRKLDVAPIALRVGG